MTTESTTDLLRRMPADRAKAIAAGIVTMWSWRPDLRRLYDSADIALISHLAGPVAPLRYSKAEDAESGEALAIEHARALNDALDAGQPATVQMLDAIAGELESTGWRINYSKQAWRVVSPEPLEDDYGISVTDQSVPAEADPQTEAEEVHYYKDQPRSLIGGVSIDGRDYRGGMWLSPKNAHETVSLNSITERLRPHVDVDTMTQADMLRAAHRYESAKADYAEFLPHHLNGRCETYLGGQKRPGHACELAWMVDRYKNESRQKSVATPAQPAKI